MSGFSEKSCINSIIFVFYLLLKYQAGFGINGPFVSMDYSLSDKLHIDLVVYVTV